MKELDFDELDRAVNSLMSSTPKPVDTSSQEPAEKIIEIGDSSKMPTPSSAPTPAVSVPVTPTPAASSPAPVTTTPLPSRRGGRFMDVVHPSSDMKKPETPRPSRQGITISPRPTSDIKEDEPQKKPEETTAKEETASLAPVAPTPVTSSETTIEEHPNAKSEWPDPLDMAGYDHKEDTARSIKEPEPTPEPAKEKEEETAEKFEPSVTEPASDTPLTSPFLPGAKVEKRPLGGLEANTSVEEPDHTPVVSDDTQKTQNDPNDQLPALPKDVEPVLPEELHSDLVEVEADTTTSGVPKTEEREDDTPVAPTLPPEPPKHEDKPVSTGPTSIPQQYHEEPTSGDEKSGAIYDTDTYHQPLAHPAKKKSGWVVVLWIVVILIVGAGGTAALYLLGVL